MQIMLIKLKVAKLCDWCENQIKSNIFQIFIPLFIDINKTMKKVRRNSAERDDTARKF